MSNTEDNTKAGQPQAELLAVLTRIATALEKQNEQLAALTSATCAISFRIEDVGTWRS